MRGTVAALLLVLLLTPGAEALGVNVVDSNVGHADFGTVPAQAFSLVYNPNAFDVFNGSTTNGIHYTRLIVTYDVQEVSDSFTTATIGGTWLGNLFHVPPQQGRQYVTSVLWNNSAWINVSTTFRPGPLGDQTKTSTFAWTICNTATYRMPNGTVYNFTDPCNTNYWGGSPNRIVHSVTFGHPNTLVASNVLNGTFLGADYAGFLIQWGNDESNNQYASLSNITLGVTPDGTFPNWTLATSANALDVAGDPAHLSLDYQVTTNGNWRDAVAGLIIRDSCDSFGCVMTKAIGASFGFVSSVLADVFTMGLGAGQRDVSKDVAQYVTEGLAILIGVPLELLVLLFADPGRSFLFVTWYGGLLGTMRFATSPNSDFSVIYETPLRFWKWVFRAISGFLTWTWGIALTAWDGITDASPITLLIIGGVILIAAILAFFTHPFGL